MDNSQHYDYITTPWEFLLGKNFHWGYFRPETDTLEKATDLLIDKMYEKINLDGTKKLLDVGCGIGNPAAYLHKKFNCTVDGISNSKNGISAANKMAQSENISQKVKFHFRDAIDNQFSENSFDVVWIMEMSHLIDDKQKLINEAFRVLKPGGQMVLCDLTFNKYPTAKEIFEWQNSLKILEKVFGKARLDTLEFYEELLKTSGFNKIEKEDISKNVIPTIRYWKENLEKNGAEVNKSFVKEDIFNFSHSCDFLEKVYYSGVWGYGIISGKKI
ncbi:MAG: class I SAM-dependent methyltransferase [Bacteroidia bacterium]|nr:class I SAM-dependent methyltransferase [Bacteroidia bacterium]